MKKMKNFYFILIFLLFTGCEKYSQPSNPQLNLNGRWDVVKIKVIIDKVNYSSQVKVLNENRASVSNFFIVGVTDKDELLLTQEFENTIINRRFDTSTTKWEFDYNSLRIRDDLSDERMDIWFSCNYCIKRNTIETDYKGHKTRYVFDIDTFGSMPSNVLVLTSQTFFTNIMIGGSQFDKAIESHLEITLHKI